jgi:hypothetical protein
VRAPPENARRSIRDNFDSQSNEIDFRNLQSEKQDSQITSIELRTRNSVDRPNCRINSRPKTSPISPASTLNLVDGGENENKFNVSASKAEPERKTRPPGIVISEIAVNANASPSIRCNRESASNVTVVSDLEKKKALSQITSTEAGR